MEICRHIFVNGNDCGFFKLIKLKGKFYWKYFLTHEDHPVLQLKIRRTSEPKEVEARPNIIEFYEEDLK